MISEYPGKYEGEVLAAIHGGALALELLALQLKTEARLRRLAPTTSSGVRVIPILDQKGTPSFTLAPVDPSDNFAVIRVLTEQNSFLHNLRARLN